MDPSQDKKLTPLVPVSSQRVVRAGLDSLARRGLEELAIITARWTRGQSFSESPQIIAISPLGMIATDWKSPSYQTYSIAIYNPETKRPSIIESKGFPAPWEPWEHIYRECFAWSPCGKYLLTLSGEWDGPVRLYDGTQCQLLDVIGYLFSDRLVWSPKGSYVATDNGRSPSFSVWDTNYKEGIQGNHLRMVERQLEPDAWLAEDEVFVRRHEGFIVNSPRLLNDFTFNPNEKLIAVSAANRLEYRHADGIVAGGGDVEEELPNLEIWSIVAFDVSNLRQRFRVEIPGPVTSMSWTNSSCLMVCCDGGVYSIEAKTAELSRLPIQAELCRCHPEQNICAFGEQQWPMERYGSGDRVFVVSWNLRTIAEKGGIGGVRDIVWSTDGKKLYAISGKNELWICKLKGESA